MISTRPSRRIAAALVLFASLATTPHALAQSDPAAARAHLKEGYELKQRGRYVEALPHLQESYRLDPQVKTLLNLADCEEKLGHFADALTHWVSLRDKAGQEHNDAIKQEAEKRLGALETRMPKIVIKLAVDAPPDSIVLRDGVVLGAVSLNTPLPVDPGKHVIAVRAKGHNERQHDVNVAEGETKQVEVTAGDVEGGSSSAVAFAPTPEQPEARSGGSPLKTIGIVTTIVGAAGVAAGAVFGVRAIALQSDANCPNNVCVIGQSDPNALRDAASSGDISTIFFIAGGVAAAAGITMWLLAPKRASASSAALFIGPSSFGLRGRF